MSTSETSALLLALDVFVFFKDNATGQFSNGQKIEFDKFQINTPSETKEKVSKGKNTYGQTFVSFNVPQPAEFEATMTEASRNIFAIQLAAASEAISLASQTLTDEDVTLVKNEWVESGFPHLNPTGFVIKNAAGDVTFVKDVDYQVDYETGLIKALTTAAAAAVTLSGTTRAITGTRLIGARQYNHTIKVVGSGKNLITGLPILFKADQITLSSQDAYDFLNGELAETPVKGRLEIPPGGDRPFQMDYINPYA